MAIGFGCIVNNLEISAASVGLCFVRRGFHFAGKYLDYICSYYNRHQGMSARFCIYLFHPLRWNMTNAVISQLTQFVSMNHLDWSDPSKRLSLFFLIVRKRRQNYHLEILVSKTKSLVKISTRMLRYLYTSWDILGGSTIYLDLEVICKIVQAFMLKMEEMDKKCDQYLISTYYARVFINYKDL